MARAHSGPEVRTPDIDGEEQEQPDDIDEMPIPGSRFETEMLLGGEVAIVKALQEDREEDGADDDVKAMKPGRHEKGRAVNDALEGERRMRSEDRRYGKDSVSKCRTRWWTYQ